MNIFRLIIGVLNLLNHRYYLVYRGEMDEVGGQQRPWIIKRWHCDKIYGTADGIWEARRKRRYWNWYG